MSFKPIQKLAVTRTLSSGEQVAVGVLAQNRQGVFSSMQTATCSSLATYHLLPCMRTRKFKSLLKRRTKVYMAYLEIVYPMAGACCYKIVFSGKRASYLIN